VAGIGKVYTEPEYQGKGYGSAVLRDALAYAIEKGAHLALLNGIRGYYPRFGFYPVFPRYYIDFDAEEAAQFSTPLSLREPKPTEIPMLAALFERHWGGRITFVRPPETWMWRAQGGDDYRQVLVIANGEEVPQGYIVGDDLAAEWNEIVVNSPDAAFTLMAIGGQLALEAGRKTVHWLMPPDDALVNFAQKLLPVTLSAQYEPDGGWMARLIDAQGLVDVLLPELIAQAQTILPELTAENLLISSKAQGTEIAMRGQPSTRAVISQQDFIQLLFGSLSASTLGLRDELHFDSIRLLQALFPPRIAALGWWDWF
jgi:predicted acetyltransferase